MKYYGIKWNKRKEKLEFLFAKISTKAKSVLPGKNRDLYKKNYKSVFKDDHYHSRRNNSLPEGHCLKLNQIVTSDLIYREDIGELQKGIRKLLKQHRAGDRFILLPLENLEDTCRKIDKMDSVLLSWYDRCDCGVFDFRGDKLESSIDYFTMQVKNINSSYLSVEFCIFLTETKTEELDKLIREDYHETQGYAVKTLTSPKSGGAIDAYSLVYYNDEFLKADQISDWISCIEWEFYNALRRYFPFMLHNLGLIPPRIEIYYTDIDYHDNNKWFWDSLGVLEHQGQFIDERQKMFFDYKGAKDSEFQCPRILYIVKDDGIEAGHLESVKDKVYCHMEDCAQEYFRFLFLSIISNDVGKRIVKYKQRLDRIKLKKDGLKNLLKLRHSFECEIDSYNRYMRDDVWKKSIETLRNEVFCNSDKIADIARRPFYISYKDFCEGSLNGAKIIDEAISVQRNEFDDKQNILQHLADYNNNSKNWMVNVMMLMVASLTLLFVIFPSRAEWAANILRTLFDKIMSGITILKMVGS